MFWGQRESHHMPTQWMRQIVAMKGFQINSFV